MENQIDSNKKFTKIFLRLVLIAIGICLLLVVAFLVYLQITKPLREANRLVNQGRCKEALPLLNEIIKKNPNNALAYERRITCNIYQFQSNVFTESQGYFLSALEDANKIIEIHPDAPGYYELRNYILRELASFEVYSVNKFAIYEIANQNAKKAIDMGINPASYAHRHYARNLIQSNNCNEGLKELQKIIDKTTIQSFEYGQYYSVYQTEGYLCLGEFDKALESAQFITCDDAVSTCKSGLLAEIYFQSKDYENALNTINYMINWQPIGGGWRYFIRALIYYEQGEKELAIQDLEIGKSYSWYPNGVYWYVEAQLAFEQGDKENGIAYLQQAEQTLDVGYNPLRQQIIKELKLFGEEPILLSPNLPFIPIPIP